jgi:hypothetical protein
VSALKFPDTCTIVPDCVIKESEIDELLLNKAIVPVVPEPPIIPGTSGTFNDKVREADIININSTEPIKILKIDDGVDYLQIANLTLYDNSYNIIPYGTTGSNTVRNNTGIFNNDDKTYGLQYLYDTSGGTFIGNKADTLTISFKTPVFISIIVISNRNKDQSRIKDYNLYLYDSNKNELSKTLLDSPNLQTSPFINIYRIKGLSTITGASGPSGAPGPSGPPGKDGKNGKDGIDGKDGKNGKDGIDGKDGKNGKDGIDGKNGKDGKDGNTRGRRLEEFTTFSREPLSSPAPIN